MSNSTHFTVNTSFYNNQDLINIINKKSILGIMLIGSSYFPLTGSINNLSNIYTPSVGSGAGQLYVVTGNATEIYENDTTPRIYLMPNCGVKVWVASGYSGACQLEAYNNTNNVVSVSTSGGSNSSVQMFQNTSGVFSNNSGSTGYTVVN